MASRSIDVSNNGIEKKDTPLVVDSVEMAAQTPAANSNRRRGGGKFLCNPFDVRSMNSTDLLCHFRGVLG